MTTNNSKAIYPKPNLKRENKNDIFDIGWNEGVLSDGRPYRMEYWEQNEISHLTFIFSTLGLRHISEDFFVDFLKQEELVHFVPGMYTVTPSRIIDAAGNEMWSVKIVIGDEDETFVNDNITIQPYH